MIAELRGQRDQLDEALLVLTRLAAGGTKRRGRPPKWLTRAVDLPTAREKLRRKFSAATRRKMAAAKKQQQSGLRTSFGDMGDISVRSIKNRKRRRHAPCGIDPHNRPPELHEQDHAIPVPELGTPRVAKRITADGSTSLLSELPVPTWASDTTPRWRVRHLEPGLPRQVTHAGLWDRRLVTDRQHATTTKADLIAACNRPRTNSPRALWSMAVILPKTE